jgi:hypothetical protein
VVTALADIRLLEDALGMGSEDKGKGAIETVANEVKGLAVEVYKDAARPAVAQAGRTAGLALEVLLAPAEIILGGFKAGFDKLKAAIQRKISGVPAERLLPAPATIAAPTALHYALLGDGEEVRVLREMFEDLLVASMDRDTAEVAHPAFASMISQLTPHEARVLKSIDRIRYEYIDLCERGGLRTMLGVGVGINEAQISVCIANFVRLGIIRMHSGFAGSYETDAPPGLVKRLESEFPGEDIRNFPGHGAVEFMHVTPFGLQFLRACANHAGLDKL